MPKRCAYTAVLVIAGGAGGVADQHIWAGGRQQAATGRKAWLVHGTAVTFGFDLAWA